MLAPLLLLLAPAVPQQDGPALGPHRLTQAEVVSGNLSLDDLRTHGMRIFATPFNRHDGHGDGPMDPFDPASPGGRPTLGHGSAFLRVNGLDSQSCFECHSVISSASIPARLGVGGAGLASASAMGGITRIDILDNAGNGFAAFNGRLINPPFMFGSGGVELVAKEMTVELRGAFALALATPDVPQSLISKGVSFGSLTYDSALQDFDYSAVEGINNDLVVRPFGRKGEFATSRAFDLGAMGFHFGIQPAELVGAGVDADGDGVVDEILAGEISALHIFGTNLERPTVDALDAQTLAGQILFEQVGCTDCHTPSMQTGTPLLDYSFPEVHTDPSANVFMSVDLANSAAGFETNPSGGLEVQLYSDLKRHDLGYQLSEETGSELDHVYITARLWGIADSGPYMHDGRATTLTDAIGMHRGEASTSRSAFMALSPSRRVALISFLKRLRTPAAPAADIQQ
ncbi:MAG: hypothetical protein ACI8QC_000202 [Planctomycetota bacterium]|jgi:hypothetical protein